MRNAKLWTLPLRMMCLIVGVASQLVHCHAGDQRPELGKKTLLAHYMPWFEAKPISPAWGWHWTMNAVNPDHHTNGVPDVASHFHPLIGPYDSSDPDVLEYHLLLMRISGIDGVIVDWYGLQQFRDYALLHRNTLKLVEQVERLGMKFAICYEDQTIPALVNEKRLAEIERVSHAIAELSWMKQHWFASKSYVTFRDQPLLLSFGQDGLTDDEWSAVFEKVTGISYFSLHQRRKAALGAFDWPLPKSGIRAVEHFQKQSGDWPTAIPVAFPGFKDFYAQAKIHESWGTIDDQNGQTLRTTLSQPTVSPLMQLATWNDWGEGTQIEPSLERGYRDLELIQTVRRNPSKQGIQFQADDLKMPRRLLNLRRKADLQPAHKRTLDEAALKISQGAFAAGRTLIEQVEQSP